MPLSPLHKELEKKKVKFLLTDYYDTIVHRTVHPNYTQRIWAKFMIREMGLPTTIDTLYFIRRASSEHLQKTLGRPDIEISYSKLKAEVCKRLINTNILSLEDKNAFISLFEAADLRAESSVQFLNQEVLGTLKKFKSNGGEIYIVSDFYGPKTLFKNLLIHHNILDLFDGIYTSADLEASKHTGNIYPPILSDLSLETKASEIMMIGDNLRSDYTHAIKFGLNAYHLPHKKYLRKNKRNSFGNDKKRVNQIINDLYKTCKERGATPYTEYIVFYHTFVERLYETAKKKGIKDLFFLSREGQFLKKLFDSYQDFAHIGESQKINTQYLRISRHAALQMSLKELEKETFDFLRKNYENISIDDFLIAVNCPEELRSQIISELMVADNTIIQDFFNSSLFESLKQNNTFKIYYEEHREASHIAFKAYINSFNTNIESTGINLVDIGWGGTMQEAIYKFYNQKVSVTGYYLGLGELYNIQPKTKRYGLNFSVYPFLGYNDSILMANRQLYEQLSAADHGSALGYCLEAEDYTLDYHKPEEKWLYENHIKAHQDKMFALHKTLLIDLETICYDQEIIQEAISKLALKIGLFKCSKKLKFIDSLNQGFYQNVGSNQVGISYKTPEIKRPIKKLIDFLITPEQYFRHLVKLKPMLYNKNRILAFFAPMYFIYLYYRFNRYIRFKVIHRYVLLKYNMFK